MLAVSLILSWALHLLLLIYSVIATILTSPCFLFWLYWHANVRLRHAVMAESCSYYLDHSSTTLQCKLTTTVLMKIDVIVVPTCNSSLMKSNSKKTSNPLTLTHTSPFPFDTCCYSIPTIAGIRPFLPSLFPSLSHSPCFNSFCSLTSWSPFMSLSLSPFYQHILSFSPDRVQNLLLLSNTPLIPTETSRLYHRRLCFIFPCALLLKRFIKTRDHHLFRAMREALSHVPCNPDFFGILSVFDPDFNLAVLQLSFFLPETPVITAIIGCRVSGPFYSL